MVDRTIDEATIETGTLMAAAKLILEMAVKGMNENAASVEAGGVRHWAVFGSERRIVIEAMDLIAVESLRQVEEVLDEVVDLHEGLVAEVWHRDVGAVVVVAAHRHGDHRRVALRRGVATSGWAKTSR